MKKILWLFAHPRPDRSEVNVELAEVVRTHDQVTFVDLYSKYPNFDINVDLEQKRLVEHDVIVFQHPLYWYSTPSILKEWQDLVLEHGFAYGSKGRALKGKLFFSVISAGANRTTYSREGGNEYEVRELYVPIERTWKLCGVEYLPPYVVYAAGHVGEDDRIEMHKQELSLLIHAIASHTLDFEKAKKALNLSDDFQSLLSKKGGEA